MSAVQKNEEQRSKWLKVMYIDFMSSEESEGESLVVHPIAWQSQYVARMFNKVDQYSKSRKSSQSQRQTKTRVNGSKSTRPQVEQSQSGQLPTVMTSKCRVKSQLSDTTHS